MTQYEIDTMWQKAMQESIKEGEMYTRYHFAKLVAEAEREACAKVCDELSAKHTWEGCYANECADAIRARGQA